MYICVCLCLCVMLEFFKGAMPVKELAGRDFPVVDFCESFLKASVHNL